MFHTLHLPDRRSYLGTLVSENSRLDRRPGLAALKWGAPWLFVRSIILAIMWVGLNLANSNAAVATPWEKLPDGRVIIQVKDVRLAFPADAEEANDIEFYDRYQIKSRMSLKEIIVEPELAQKLFSDARLVYVSIPNLMDRKGLYLGQFTRSEFRSFSASLVVGEGAQVTCEQAAAHSAQLEANLAPDDARIKGTGWAEFETSKHPLSLTYVRPDASHPDFFPGISCDYFKICGSDKCVGADVSIAFLFSGRIIKQEDWKSFEAKVYQLFKYLLIDLVK